MVSRSAKLDYQMGYMVVRQEETTKIFLNEISTVIIETTAVSITGTLMSELMKNKIKVIFCDEKRNPSSELIPYYGAHDTSAKVRNQIAWTDDIKATVCLISFGLRITSSGGMGDRLSADNSFFSSAESIKLKGVLPSRLSRMTLLI